MLSKHRFGSFKGQNNAWNNLKKPLDCPHAPTQSVWKNDNNYVSNICVLKQINLYDYGCRFCTWRRNLNYQWGIFYSAYNHIKYKYKYLKLFFVLTRMGHMGCQHNERALCSSVTRAALRFWSSYSRVTWPYGEPPTATCTRLNWQLLYQPPLYTI